MYFTLFSNKLPVNYYNTLQDYDLFCKRVINVGSVKGPFKVNINPFLEISKFILRNFVQKNYKQKNLKGIKLNQINNFE